MASKVHQITVWARGVVQDKEGRDIANGLASAAGKDGKFTQSFDNYVDLPDRVNVPLRKYARISDAAAAATGRAARQALRHALTEAADGDAALAAGRDRSG